MADDQRGIWYSVERARDRVLLEHGNAGDEVPVAALLISAEAAAAVGASLIAYAIDIDPETARAKVLEVLTPRAWGGGAPRI